MKHRVAGLLLAVLFCVAGAGCAGQDRTLADVSVFGVTPDIVTLQAAVTYDNGKQFTASFQVADLPQDSGARQFSLRFPDLASGPFALDVAGLQQDGQCVVARGHVDMMLSGAREVAVSIALSPLQMKQCATDGGGGGPFMLAVALSGSGTGRVTSGGGEINCGTTCSANLAGGTQVVLTATADTGSRFAGWQGPACQASGTGPCTVVVSAMSQVTAVFSKCGSDGWCQEQSPVSQDLKGIWGSGPTDIWAVGYDAKMLTAAIVHYDGTRWSQVQVDRSAQLLQSVWGSGPADVWALGLGTSVHWDGALWKIVQTPTTNLLIGVSGSAKDNLLAVGESGTALKWKGGPQWQAVASTVGSKEIDSVWLDPQGNVWAVGEGNLVIQGTTDVLQPAGTAGGTAYLHGVHGSGAKVWAVGDGGAVHRYSAGWSQVQSGTAAALYGVFAIAPDDVWVVGDKSTLLHWDGTSFKQGQSPTMPTTMLGVWASAPGSVWAVGKGGIILRHYQP